MRKIFIEHSSGAYQRLFERLGFQIVYAPDAADVVCFTGGADVSPSMYGAAQHPYTANDPYRDDKESRLFRFCRQENIPMVGICRGGQFLNVMSGGEMYQHVDGHGRYHEIIDVDSGETILVSSTHHQMMKPAADAKLIAYSTLMGSREWYEGSIFKRDISQQDIEVVYYKHSNCLCFQPHPEFFSPEEELPRMSTYFGELISQYLVA